MNGKVLLGGAVLLLLATVSTNARPEGSSATAASFTSTTVAGESSSSTTAAPEESKITRFFDDVSSAFMQGTAKVKESFESAASSVKDGVLRGYDYVKDKFQGSTADTPEPGNNGTASKVASTTSRGSGRALGSSTDALSTTSTTVFPKTISPRTFGSVDSTPKKPNVYKIEPNDEESADDGRIVFKDTEETGTDSPVMTTTTTLKSNLDDRFIIDGPPACKTGETLINGKCRTTY